MLYVPHSPHAACGNLGALQRGQVESVTGVAFHWERRERVLLRDILRLGTAISARPSWSGVFRASRTTSGVVCGVAVRVAMFPEPARTQEHWPELVAGVTAVTGTSVSQGLQRAPSGVQYLVPMLRVVGQSHAALGAQPRTVWRAEWNQGKRE